VEPLAGFAAKFLVFSALVQAITAGADVLRVHDVAPIVQTARMTDAIVRGLA
jgi:dihydropteroate synthase